VARDLRGLLTPHPAPVDADGTVTCGEWSAVARGDQLHLAGSSDAERRVPNQGDSSLDALRTLCVAAWNSDLTVCTADDDAAQSVLAEFGLS
jgi:hypothetical protein